MSTVETPDISTIEPEDDAVVVTDEARAKNREELVKKVQKVLARPPKEKKGKAKAPKQQAGSDEKAAAEEVADTDKPEELSQAVKDRAKEAGISEELAGRLHQSGLLDESLAAFDRLVIERFTASQAEPETTPEPKRDEQKPPPAVKDQARHGAELEPLDADEYGEELAKRDRIMRGQIAELTAQVQQLTQHAGNTQDRATADFEDWFEAEVAGLGNEELFGSGSIESLPQQSPLRQNRETLMRAYLGVCQGFRMDPMKRHKQAVERALNAMFSKDIVKQAQRKTVDRLRSAEGQFVSPARSGGEMPEARKAQTPEERRAALVADVASYLKSGKRK